MNSRDIKHIDFETIQELQDVMEDDFSALITTYLDDSGIRIESIRHLLNNQNFDDLSKTAHSFKGSSGNIGAVHLAELCRLLEKAGESERITEAQMLLDQISIEFEEVKKQIVQLIP